MASRMSTLHVTDRIGVTALYWRSADRQRPALPSVVARRQSGVACSPRKHLEFAALRPNVRARPISIASFRSCDGTSVSANSK